MGKRTCSVEGCDGVYHALGFCKRHYRRARRGHDLHAAFATNRRLAFWARVDQTGGLDACWPWTGGNYDRKGYGRYHDPVSKRDVRAHRYAAAQAFGPIPPGGLACHHCDNPACCNPLHLYIGTVQSNSDDMRSRGRERKAVGEENGNARLTAEMVRDLRHASEMGVSLRALARLTGLARPTIKNAIEGETWRHVL